MSNNINNKFVTFKIAKLLCELQFEEECFARYNREENSELLTSSPRHAKDYNSMVKEENDINELSKFQSQFYSAPLWQDVLEWIIKKHSIVIYNTFDKKKKKTKWAFTNTLMIETKDTPKINYFSSYEEGREISIIEVLEFLKNQNK